MRLIRDTRRRDALQAGRERSPEKKKRGKKKSKSQVFLLSACVRASKQPKPHTVSAEQAGEGRTAAFPVAGRPCCHCLTTDFKVLFAFSSCGLREKQKKKKHLQSVDLLWGVLCATSQKPDLRAVKKLVLL